MRSRSSPAGPKWIDRDAGLLLKARQQRNESAFQASRRQQR
jgi:hypothetical protein